MDPVGLRGAPVGRRGGIVAIERIESVQLPVADLGRAREFYQRLLGTGPSASNEDAPGGAAVFDVRGSGATLYPQRPPAPHDRPDEPIASPRVSTGADIGALLDTIESGEGEVTYRESLHPDQLVAGFRDPEGNQLELLIPR